MSWWSGRGGVDYLLSYWTDNPFPPLSAIAPHALAAVVTPPPPPVGAIGCSNSDAQKDFRGIPAIPQTITEGAHFQGQTQSSPYQNINFLCSHRSRSLACLADLAWRSISAFLLCPLLFALVISTREWLCAYTGALRLLSYIAHTPISVTAGEFLMYHEYFPSLIYTKQNKKQDNTDSRARGMTRWVLIQYTRLLKGVIF